MIIFISGGVRSGKSTYAEEIAIKYANEKNIPLYYLATSLASDDLEMKERIRIHQEMRDQKWQTIEEPFALDKALALIPNQSIILIECMTVWLSTAMFIKKQSFPEITEKMVQVFEEIRRKKHILLMVSNDVNEEIPIQDSFVQEYVFYLEQLHKKIIYNSEQAIQVVAGIPQFWKGDSV